MQGSWWLVGLVGMAGAGLAQGEDRTRDAGVALDAVCARPIWGRPLPQVVGISDDALGATRMAVQAFNRDVETYLDCLEQAEQKVVSQGSTSGLDLAAVQEAMIDRNDAAVDEITRVAEAFNEGLRARKLAEAEPARPAVKPDTLPSLVEMPKGRVLDSCFPDRSTRRGEESRVTATVAVQIDGTGRLVSVPAGTPEHVREGAICAVQALRFRPATLAGQPIEAQVTLPINFGLGGRGPRPIAALKPPQMKTPFEKLAATRTECYPEGFTGSGEVLLDILVDTRGRPVRVRTLDSSGDQTVDEVAECLLERAQFEPGTRDGERIETSVRWKVRVGR